MPQKLPLKVFFHPFLGFKKLVEMKKMMLFPDQVARPFLEVFGVGLFFLLIFVLEKYGWYKICSSDVALSNKKKFDSLRCS
jgi:hypothetical protein